MSDALAQQLESWPKLYDALHKSGGQQDILAIHQFGQALTDALAEQTDEWTGIINLWARQLPAGEAFPLLSALNTALLCQHQHWNQSAIVPLVCAALCLSATATRPPLLASLKQLNAPLWYQALKPVARLLPHRKKPAFWRAINRLPTYAQLLITGAQLALTQLPHRNNTAERVKGLATKLPTACYPYLSDWLRYPSVSGPGVWVVSDDGDPELVLSVGQDSRLLQSGSIHSEHDTSGYQHWAPLSALVIADEQPALALEQARPLWGEEWQTSCHDRQPIAPDRKHSYPIGRPPAKLLAIHQLLQKPNVDVDKVAIHIASEGYLAHQLKHSATQQSRLKLPMKEVKHALLYEGFDRTHHVLIQQALMNRLNQNAYPLQQPLIQLTLTVAESLSRLAYESRVAMPEEATTLGYFACGGLFTCHTLKSMVQLPVPMGEAHQLGQLLNLPNNHVVEHSVKLCRSWQQSKHLVSAIQRHSELPSERPNNTEGKLATLLGAGLILAQQLYFGRTDFSRTTQDYLLAACHQLKLPPERMTALLEDVASGARCYSTC